MHRLLQRQLKRLQLEPADLPPETDTLLELVNQAYEQFDADKKSLAKSLEISSSELIQRNALMRAVFQALPDVFLWIDQDGVIKDCKGGVEQLFGLKSTSLINAKAHRIPEVLDPGTYVQASQILLQEPFFQTTYSRARESQILHFEVRFARLNTDMILALIRDISDRVRAEESFSLASERLSNIIEHLPDPTMVVDSEHRLIAWNKAIEDLTGIPKDRILGQGDYAYALPFYGFRRPVLLDFIDKDPSDHYPVWSHSKEENILVAEVFVPALYNGQGAFVWAKATPLHDRHGQVTGAIQTIRDITAKKRTEVTTSILFQISTAAGQTISDSDLFATVFDIVVSHLEAVILFVSINQQTESALTYPYFARTDDATPAVLKRLHTLAAQAEKSPEPELMELAALDSQNTPRLCWHSASLRYGQTVLGSVVMVLPAGMRHISGGDPPVLAAISDLLSQAITRKATENLLRRSEEKHRSIFENAREGIFQITLDHDLLSANPAMARILGHADLPALMAESRDFLHRLLPAGEKVRILDQVLRDGGAENFEIEYRTPAGHIVWLSINMWAVRRPDGSIRFLEGSARDVTRQREAERKLAVQKSLFAQLFDNSPQGILLLGQDGTPVDLNPSFTRMFGFARNELNSLFEILLPPDNLEESYALVATVLRGTSISQETQRRTKDGKIIPVSMVGYPYVLEGRIAGAFFIFGDISERKHYETQLTRQALHDSLTGLPNRVLFMDRLTQAMARQKRRPDFRFAVLMIDLDSFKRVNDTQGHQAGDQLLVEVAKRLSGALRSMDTVARMGGDEFAVLLEDFQSNQEAIIITRRLLHDVRQPMLLQGRETQVSASVGVVLQTSRYVSPDDLLRDADISMYRSKELGRNQFKIFSKSMYEQVIQAVQLENDLRKAMVDNELELFFQPIYAMNGRVLTGFEALLRWNHPEQGMIGPDTFIPVAEESGLISELAGWVMLHGFQTMARWIVMYPDREISLALNLSPKDLVHPGLVGQLTDLLRETGVEARHFKLEITETAVMNNPDLATAKLERLQAMGFQIAMDDFGTGYSSLSYLQRLPIDILKIDRSFVQTMLENPNNLEIIKAIIGLGKILDLHIVAEGVETSDQLQTLTELGCDLGQGFFLGKPMPLATAEALLHQSDPGLASPQL